MKVNDIFKSYIAQDNRAEKKPSLLDYSLIKRLKIEVIYIFLMGREGWIINTTVVDSLVDVMKKRLCKILLKEHIATGS